MDQYTVFMCIGQINPEIKQACEQKGIPISELGYRENPNNYTCNEIAVKLIKHKTVFVEQAQCFITKKLRFRLIDEIKERIGKLSANYILILNKPIKEYYNDEQHQIKRITSGWVLTMQSSNFISKPLIELIPKKENIADMNRIKAIAPCFYHYNLQDLLPFLYEILQDIGRVDYKSNHINNWSVLFDNSFDTFNDDTKYLLLRKLEEKYKDFDEIIFRTSSDMKSQFSESGKSKLRTTGMPEQLHLRHAELRDGKLRFRIIVEEEGKKSTYFHSAGGFFVPWT